MVSCTWYSKTALKHCAPTSMFNWVPKIIHRVSNGVFFEQSDQGTVFHQGVMISVQQQLSSEWYAWHFIDVVSPCALWWCNIRLFHWNCERYIHIKNNSWPWYIISWQETFWNHCILNLGNSRTAHTVHSIWSGMTESAAGCTTINCPVQINVQPAASVTSFPLMDDLEDPSKLHHNNKHAIIECTLIGPSCQRWKEWVTL